MSFASIAGMKEDTTAPAIVDTHAHLDYLLNQEGTTPEEAMKRAEAEGVNFIVNPSVSPKNFDQVMAIAERIDNVYAAVAIHPTDVSDTADVPDWLEKTETLLAHPKVVAVGETGLDYYWSTEHVETQKNCLKQFMALAVKHDLPIIIHDRDKKTDPKADAEQDDGLGSSHDDIYDLVKEVDGLRGIMHCFSGDTDFANKMIAQNFYISFAGNVTFKNAKKLQAAAAEISLDRILVETDSPFLSPMPYRGKPNEPARVRLVVEKIAELRGISYKEVAEVTTANARKVFGIA